jgi:hypothetical protein
MFARRAPTVAFILVAAPLTLLALSLFGAFPWSGLNCDTTEIDLYSGRIRSTRYLFWIPVRQTVSESALTHELLPTDIHADQVSWQPVVTLSPGVRHSPHYYYHGAIAQIREVQIRWELRADPKASRRAAAIELLRIWRSAGCSEGRRFIDEKFDIESAFTPSAHSDGRRAVQATASP